MMRSQAKKYQNLLMFGLSLFVAGIFYTSGLSKYIASNSQKLGLIGAIMGGVMWASTFSMATGGLILGSLVKSLPLWQLIVFGCLGAVFCDLMIFSFTKKNIAGNIAKLETIKRFEGRHRHLNRILHSHYFGWTLPVLGALFIASPLPDELGVSLMGISKMSIFEFIIISGLSHAMGIVSIVMAKMIF